MNENYIWDTFPKDIKEKYNHITIDGKYACVLVVSNYLQKIEFAHTLNILNNMFVNYSIHVSKLNSAEYIRKLTRVISNTKSEITTGHGNQQDIDIINNIVEQAKQLRREIQVNNQEIFSVDIFIVIQSNSKEDLAQQKMNAINMLYTVGIVATPLNFRQLIGYKACLPTNEIDPNLQINTHKIVTTKGLACMFPFYTNQIYSNNGIFIGQTQNTPCSIDLFDTTSLNHNTCIFGSSGAGKSFFVKTYIMKNLYEDVRQIVFDVEGEYEEIANIFGGTVIDKNSYNIFYIEKEFIKQNPNFLCMKVNNIFDVLNYNQEVREHEQQIKQAICNIYEHKKISYELHNKYYEMFEQVILDKEQVVFPTVEDFIKELKSKKDTAKVLKKISYILSNLNSNCIINFNKKLIVYSLKDVPQNIFQNYLYMWLKHTEEFYGTKLVIYIDEFWKFINDKKNDKLKGYIEQLFKTLRKQKAGIIAITQDIADIAMLDDGKFGKVLLNNSYYKFFFKIGYVDYEYLSKLFNDNYIEYLTTNINTLKRGEAIVDMGGTTFKLEVQSTQTEKKIIEEMREEKNEKSFSGDR